MIANIKDISYDSLYKTFEERISHLSKLPKMDKNNSIEKVIEENGFSMELFLSILGNLDKCAILSSNVL